MSASKGIAVNNVCIKIFNPLMLEIVLKGLNTLKTLRLETESYPPAYLVEPVSANIVST